jgi:AcrR family transcriptional regulator
MVSSALSTRARILEAGVRLLSTAGLSGITLGVLADETGMSKSGLFAHFGSKEEVQIALLERTAEVANAYVIAPSMQSPEGLPRLKVLVENWLGWSAKAGLGGGCAVAAGIFELDDREGPVRERLLAMEKQWRQFLEMHVRQAMALGHLRPDADAEQFVWELCGIYLSHHAAVRFVRDPNSDARAQVAFDALIQRSLPPSVSK